MPAKLAAQLYTVREYTQSAKGFDDVLGLCHEIGYEGVQLSAVGCMNGDHPEVDAKQAREMLDAHGLVCCATHAPFQDLRDHPDREIERHRTLGCDYTAIGGIWPDDVSGFYRFLDEVKPVVDELKRAGLRFGYHNHSHEFVRVPNLVAKPGVPASGTAYELLIENGGPNFLLEIDTYWAQHAGVDPARLIERCAGRVPVIHVKDKQVVPKEGPTYAPIGEGNLDWPAILTASQKAGVEWLVVEQDTCLRDPFDCLRSSWEFLDKLLAAS